jgi:hypothetical protein
MNRKEKLILKEDKNIWLKSACWIHGLIMRLKQPCTKNIE